MDAGIDLQTQKLVLVPIANGTEEVEALSIVDTLRRAGANVIITSIENDKTITTSHNVHITADKLLSEVNKYNFDLIALPGGLVGAEHFRDSKPLIELLQRQKESKLFYGAICASPAVVFEPHGLLAGVDACTCYPFLQKDIKSSKILDQDVVVSSNCITSKGPATALLFGIECVRALYGDEMANAIKNQMLIK